MQGPWGAFCLFNLLGGKVQGFGVESLGFRLWKFRDSALGFRVQGSEIEGWSLGLSVQGLGIRA